jgi:hypothetical protein
MCGGRDQLLEKVMGERLDMPAEQGKTNKLTRNNKNAKNEHKTHTRLLVGYQQAPSKVTVNISSSEKGSTGGREGRYARRPCVFIY